MAQEPTRVKLVVIDKLFRQYNHIVELRHAERVTILHGRNGVGKTVTLALLAALLQGNYSKILSFPFERMRVEFTDGAFIEVRTVHPLEEQGTEPAKSRKEESRGQVHVESYLDVKYSCAGLTKSFKISRSDLGKAENLARNMPWIVQIAEDGWHNRQTEELLTTEGLLERYGGMIPRGIYETEHEELRAFRKTFSVHFIEAQRLFEISTAPLGRFYRGGPAITSTVSDISKQLAARIKDTDSLYRSTSTRLDDSFPSRLFSAKPVKVTKFLREKLKERTDALEKERQRLRGIGLVEDPAKPFDPDVLNNTMRAMFGVYLKDNEEKLSVFKDLADRSELLLWIIQRKFAPKKVRIDKDNGYKVFSHDGRELELEKLSSGEQHELVLLHNLLFRVNTGALLLIDEPELSLHVTWQNEFLSDLIEIAKQGKFDVVIATHSPYIVGDRRDLMVRLGEPV